jgi:hypothetical protein
MNTAPAAAAAAVVPVASSAAAAVRQLRWGVCVEQGGCVSLLLLRLLFIFFFCSLAS